MLTITHSTLTFNAAVGGPATAWYGGGVSNGLSGTLVRVSSTVRSNRVDGGAAGDRYGGAVYGVGIHNAGLALVEARWILSNTTHPGTAPRYGGSASGGGVSNPGTLAVEFSAVAGNLAQGRRYATVLRRR